ASSKRKVTDPYLRVMVGGDTFHQSKYQNVHLAAFSLSPLGREVRTREMAVVDSPTGVIIAALFLHAVTAMVSGSDAVLMLERLIPPNHELSLTQLRAFDSARHGRLLQSPVGGVVDFPVYGASDPFLVGLYYTKVKLGTPPREFNVQIDTGSDVLWVSCTSCNGCPKTSELQIQLSFFDPGASSSALMVSCSDRRCYSNFQTESGCSPNNLCSYTFKYGDGSGTSGYYISDFISFDTVITSTLAINSSAPFVFGCSNLQTGDLQRPRRAVDGIFGLGQGRLSVISQLAMQGLAPRVFSHCLKGDKSGGGVMVLGQIKRPDIVYTPLVPSQPHYNVNLQSIAVNNQILPIDPSISIAVSQYGRPITYESYQCFDIASGAVDAFPEVSLSFAGGASMVLKPRGYLQYFSSSGSSIWCIGFQRMSHRRITILGDLVLKDKVVVYDLVRQRIGWAEYDCSLEVNVSATRGGQSRDVINTGQWRENSSESGYTSYYLLLLQVVLFLHLLLSRSFSFF
ncbi:unnamed protein product, partial [Thlaspi arvense]